MRHPILYYPNAADLNTVVETYARVHRDFNQTGSTKGFASATVEVFEEDPIILFSKTDMETAAISALKHKAIISVLENEVYCIEDVKPSDDEYIKVICSRLLKDEAQTYGFPVHT